LDQEEMRIATQQAIGAAGLNNLVAKMPQRTMPRKNANAVHSPDIQARRPNGVVSAPPR